jgi:hypothetical protein
MDTMFHGFRGVELERTKHAETGYPSTVLDSTQIQQSDAHTSKPNATRSRKFDVSVK